jgi:hypothetical protein
MKSKFNSIETKNRLFAFILALVMIIACFIVPSTALGSENIGNQDIIDFTPYAVSETQMENGVLFEIAIPAPIFCSDSISVEDDSIGTGSRLSYIDVGLSGSGGSVKGSVWRIGTVAPHNIEIALLSGSTNGYASTKVAYTNTTNIPEWPSNVDVSWKLAGSRFIKVKLSGVIGGTTIDYETYEFLFNKNGIRYPDVTDCFGNVYMTVPASSIWIKVANPVNPLTTSERNAYMAWYEQTYNKGKALNWTDVQIHHIRPRAYGGTHAYSNLMPLKTSVHTTVTTWWANY